MAISNVVELKQVVSQHESASLYDVAKAINIKLRLADQNENEARNHRTEAGEMLISLRTRVEADGQDWWKFAKDYFDRTRKELEKLMTYVAANKIAKAAIAANPELDGVSAREVAKKLGVSHQTVGRVRQQQVVGPDGPTEKRTGKDGKQYKASKPPKPVSLATQEKQQSARPQSQSSPSSTLIEQAMGLVARMTGAEREIYKSKMKETYQW